LREILLGSVDSADDLEIVGDVPVSALVKRIARRPEADVVVMGDDNPALALRLLEQRPRLKVLAVGGDGADARLYELRPKRVLLGDVSPQALVEAIREVGGATWSETAWTRP
jgi:DNA-binding NarL/FixJ family response regulator